MRRVVIVVIVVAVIIIGLAVFSDSLPEGPLKDFGDGVKDVGNNLSRAFGGGYGELPQP